MSGVREIVLAIAEVGRGAKLAPPLHLIRPFEHFFIDGMLDVSRLHERDGGCTRRELLLRALLLNAVLDQGPDLEGVREMMLGVINRLYEQEIRIFHTPLDFFKEINVSVERIWRTHETVKTKRSEEWARVNQSTASKYNLYMDNSHQTLNYAVFRWGVPLALPYLLSKEADEKGQPTALLDYLQEYDSAEKMSNGLKDHERYGLGKAIGDKACHLFAKWMVSTFGLSTLIGSAWGAYSYEVPFDSNAGRVLWRTGYFLELADLQSYKNKNVVQSGTGKGGDDYLRITNIRGMKMTSQVDADIDRAYEEICLQHLKSHKRAPRALEIQRFQHPILFLNQMNVDDFDDGLIEIGRQYCHNHDEPDCGHCPIRQHCKGYLSDPTLITDYKT